MNPKTIFLYEFCKLIGRLGQAAANGDTQGFLGLIQNVRKLCDTIEQNLTFRVVDDDQISDEEL